MCIRDRSEGSPDSVITHEDGMLKRAAHGECLRPVSYTHLGLFCYIKVILNK